MDSMMEIFYEEATSLVNELKNAIQKYKDCKTYDAEFINNVFRIIHTMKADSTMMLLDTIAVPSRMFESLLVFFRNNKLDIEDKESFDNIIQKYVGYVSDDIERFAKGEQLEHTHKDLEEDIKNYLEKLKEEYKDQIKSTSPVDIASAAQPKKRQVYYIASTDTSMSANKDAAADTAKKTETQKKMKLEENAGDAVVLIKQKDIDRIYKSIKHYNKFVNSIEERFNGDRRIEIRHRDLMMLKNIKCEMSDAVAHLTKSDFVAIAQKMEIIVDEMSVSLKKPVKLIVRGAETLFDKSKREKISSALVHIIRNAVDHGIESMDVREQMGKAPVGIIRLSFKKKDDKLVITIEDDGAGIDKKAILKSAEKNNILKKPAEEYTDEEIINLMYASGVSTTEKPNDYSGRGVGMDVIHHNIISLGGTINITSNYGYGTKVKLTL